MKKDPLKRKPQDQSEAKLLADVKDPGWHVIGVMEGTEGPAFAYTIGLFYNYRHPEIIAFGLDVQLLWRIVNNVGHEVKEGKTFEDCHEADDILKGYNVFFRTVSQRHYRDYLGYARWFYDGDDFPTLQCLWPDKSRRYPWHPAAPEAFRQRQPAPYDPSAWQYQEGSNRHVFTTKPVIHGGLPILLVSHETDGDWQFLCGTTNNLDDAAVVSLGCILERDQTLLELADLPEGWEAKRKKSGGTWKRERKHET